MIGLDTTARQGSEQHCSHQMTIVEGQGADRLIGGRKS